MNCDDISCRLGGFYESVRRCVAETPGTKPEVPVKGHTAHADQRIHFASNNCPRRETFLRLSWNLKNERNNSYENTELRSLLSIQRKDRVGEYRWRIAAVCLAGKTKNGARTQPFHCPHFIALFSVERKNCVIDVYSTSKRNSSLSSWQQFATGGRLQRLHDTASL
jgi:hypothetical protein